MSVGAIRRRSCAAGGCVFNWVKNEFGGLCQGVFCGGLKTPHEEPLRLLRFAFRVVRGKMRVAGACVEG